MPKDVPPFGKHNGRYLYHQPGVYWSCERLGNYGVWCSLSFHVCPEIHPEPVFRYRRWWWQFWRPPRAVAFARTMEFVNNPSLYSGDAKQAVDYEIDKQLLSEWRSHTTVDELLRSL